MRISRWLGLVTLAAVVLPMGLVVEARCQQALAMDGLMRSSAMGLEEAYLPTVAHSNHAANLIQLKNGDLLCFWFGGAAEGQSGVAILESRLPRGSKQWSKAQVVDREQGVSYQNPVPFETPSGELWLLHTSQPVKEGQAKAQVLRVKSADGGRTWGPVEVLFNEPGAFVRDPLLMRKDGAWLLPMYYTPTSAITTGAESHYSVVKVSKDAGKSWQECRIPESNGYVQPSVVKQRDHYVAFFRSRFADSIFRSTSSDGCAWTAPVATALPNNNASIQAVALKDGRIAMVFNRAHAEPVTGKPATGPRVPLVVAISADEGKSWPEQRVVEAGRRAEEDAASYAAHVKADSEYDEYSYPSIVQAKDGRLWVAFTYRRKTIKVVSFRAGWVEK